MVWLSSCGSVGLSAVLQVAIGGPIAAGIRRSLCVPRICCRRRRLMWDVLKTVSFDRLLELGRDHK
eukprot:7220992-Pyramimonas_sp.AAC.1